MVVKAKKKKTSSRTTREDRDYVAIADAFAKEAVADVDGKRYGKWTRLAAVRYVNDRKRAALKRDFYFSPSHANNHCDFIEKLPHVEGTWKDENGKDAPFIILHPSHVFLIVNIFGFRNEDGTRRFTSALFAVARKNAKSTVGGAILLSCLCLENELGPQVISAATTGSQARIVWNIAKRMVEKTPDLREHFNLDVFANSITAYDVGGSFKPINAKASTQDGLNPSHVILDEIHAHKTHDLLNVLQSAAGARLNALWLYTTTEGYETPGPWPEMRLFAHHVLNGMIDEKETDHFFFLIFSLDEQVGQQGEPDFKPADDDFDETKWIKANPLMDVNPILKREIRKAANDAKQMPGRHAEFKIKRLNRQAAAANTWLNIEKWKLCSGPVDLAAMAGKDCWAALDGAATTDIMAFRLAWRIDGVVYTWGRRWVPTVAVTHRTERGLVPYAGWVQSGLITQLPGETLDYAIIEKDIVELCNKYHPKIVAYDPWNVRDLVNRLTLKLGTRQTKDGKTVSILEEFRQGPKSYHPAMQETERLYLAGKLQHGNDAVLNWCAANVVPRRDENMNMSPDRKNSADKIDDAAALFMSIGAMTGTKEPEKKLQLFFV